MGLRLLEAPVELGPGDTERIAVQVVDDDGAPGHDRRVDFFNLKQQASRLVTREGSLRIESNARIERRSRTADVHGALIDGVADIDVEALATGTNDRIEVLVWLDDADPNAEGEPPPAIVVQVARTSTNAM